MGHSGVGVGVEDMVILELVVRVLEDVGVEVVELEDEEVDVVVGLENVGVEVVELDDEEVDVVVVLEDMGVEAELEDVDDTELVELDVVGGIRILELAVGVLEDVDDEDAFGLEVVDRVWVFELVAGALEDVDELEGIEVVVDPVVGMAVGLLVGAPDVMVDAVGIPDPDKPVLGVSGAVIVEAKVDSHEVNPVVTLWELVVSGIGGGSVGELVLPADGAGTPVLAWLHVTAPVSMGSPLAMPACSIRSEHTYSSQAGTAHRLLHHRPSKSRIHR